MPGSSQAHQDLDAHQQQSGGRYVIERHTDDLGAVYQVGPYLAPDGYDTAARMAARADEISAQLAEAEAQELINGA